MRGIPVYSVPALVVVVDVTVGPPAPDEVRHRVGNRAELLAAVPQLLFVALPLGDVERDAGDAHRTPRFVAHRAAGTEQPRLAPIRVEHAVLGPELALIQCALHVPMHARPVRRVHPVEKPRQAHRRIVAGANQQAEPGRPVAAVASDVPLPYARVDTFLCDVEAVIRPLEVALGPERVCECLLQTVAQQANDEGHARQTR